MTILHVDKLKSPDNFFKEIYARDDIEYFFSSTLFAAIGILEKEKVDLILIGEELDGSRGLDFIKKVSTTDYYSIPMSIIIDDATDFNFDCYFSLGITDSVLRDNLTVDRLLNYIEYINEQDTLFQGMKELDVAVIDDSKISHMIIHDILDNKGITKIEDFYNPIEFLKSNKNYDLYIIDIIMPDITGDKLSRIIRRNSPHSIIIIMSLLDNSKAIFDVLSAGADDYIIKPFNKDILLARLKTNFRSYKLIRDLDRLSKTDALTGAYNHGFIFDKLREEVEFAKLKSSCLSLLFMDLDLFKKVNDTYGHPVGDRVLVQLSEIFKENSRKTDHYGRYGGEEFLFVMPHTDIEQAKVFTQRLHEMFSDTRIKGIDKSVTFSGGLVQYDGKESHIDLIKRADDLLYEAKRSGRNIIKF